MNKVWLALVLTVLVVSPVLAQEPPPPPEGANWGEVIHPDGSLRADNLTDLGEVRVAVDWMPNLPFLEGQASYHQYAAPDGTLVLLPSASTLFFMGLNPQASGLDQSQAALGNGLGFLELTLAGYLSPQALAQTGYSEPADFYQALIQGQNNLWTFDFMGNLLWDLLTLSLADGNLYSMLLLYPPGTCTGLPGGCPPGARPAQAGGPPRPTSCPAPFLRTGPIVIQGGSGQGGKIAPLRPVVVGQDPERRGVDVQVRVSIPPVIQHTFQAVPQERRSCVPAPGNGSGCPGFPGNRNYNTRIERWVDCVEHTRAFEDRLASAVVSIRLDEVSRRIILTELAQAYPGAHLIQPDFTFRFGGAGSQWSQLLPNIPTADPGRYQVTVSVRTTGTPVSAPRSVSGGLGSFVVELLRVTLIGQP